MAEHEEQRAPSSSLVWPSRDSCRQSQQRPTLCVVAGPNGSGKTTTTELLLANEWGGRDFVFETVFSSAEKLEFLRKAHDEGFFIRLFYVCTKSPEINVARIAKRYMNGGHEVPISKVVSRYFKSLEQVKQAITFVDRAYIYDNSVEDHLPQLLYRTTDGSLAKQYVADVPEWAEILL